MRNRSRICTWLKQKKIKILQITPVITGYVVHQIEKELQLSNDYHQICSFEALLCGIFSKVLQVRRFCRIGFPKCCTNLSMQDAFFAMRVFPLLDDTFDAPPCNKQSGLILRFENDASASAKQVCVVVRKKNKHLKQRKLLSLLLYLEMKHRSHNF